MPKSQLVLFLLLALLLGVSIAEVFNTTMIQTGASIGSTKDTQDTICCYVDSQNYVFCPTGSTCCTSCL